MSALEPSRVRYLIIGGGVTGLAFAGRLRSPDFVLCEAADDVGGYCRTVQQAGFTWDYSGHFFHFRHPEIERELVERIGRERIKTVSKRSFIDYAGRWIDFPFQRHIHQLPPEEFLECLADLVETLRHPPAQPATSFHEMLQQRLGRGICQRFLVPYNEKLYATDLSRLDVEAMGRFFPHADVFEIVRGFVADADSSYNATFTYPEGGAIAYVRALQADVPEERVLLNEPVLELDLQRRVATTATRRIAYDAVISSMPFPRLLECCKLGFDPELYQHNKVLVFNLGFDKKGPRDVHWLYYPQRHLAFYRVGFYDNIWGSERMSLYVELGFRAAAVLDEVTIAALRVRVLAELSQVGLVTDHRLVAHHHVILDPAYVHITRQANDDVAHNKELLAQHGVYSIGRYGSWTYCSIEDNVVEARALANELQARVQP